MQKMINLKQLLIHEVQDLYSAEEQIIEALPKMIEKAKNKQLKKSLQDHLQVTGEQKNRLDQVKELLIETGEDDSNEKENGGRKKGFLKGLFGGGETKCKGMEGLISEGEKVMGEDMSPEVMDAAIIASAQKIEHYEICGYGTARAYARELNLGEVAELLEETLDEEYEADDLLTDLAVGKVNEEAETGRSSEKTSGNGSSTRRNNGKTQGSNGSGRKSATVSKSASKSSAKKNGSTRSSDDTSKRSTTSKTVKSASGRKSGTTSRTRSSSGRSKAGSK
ncbi:MAG TPA: DUF892 family protein [Chitinophagaceae bacterium]